MWCHQTHTDSPRSSHRIPRVLLPSYTGYLAPDPGTPTFTTVLHRSGFKLFCGQIDALAFLPLGDIPAGMTSLCDNTPDGADELLSYFDRTYVTGSYRRAQPGHGQIGIRVKRIIPLYPPAVWNVHEATLAGEPRTNNQCEG